MRVALVVLPEQILAVVVPVRRAHDAVDVLPRGLPSLYTRHVDRRLVVELDQHHRALDPVVEDAVRTRPADPGEVGLVQMLTNLVHLHPGVPVPHVPDMLSYEVE